MNFLNTRLKGAFRIRSMHPTENWWRPLLNDAAMAGAGARLRPDEWKSVDRLWLVELCAPFHTEENKQNEAMVADLMRNVFTRKSFKMHVTDPLTGKREVKEIRV
ncbi:MAG: toxin-activating lysine-acyltransferase [Pseudomonadota bacterium]